jgi:pSer/pThr/pTyr-binding forkhead associated (FHA) protein
VERYDTAGGRVSTKADPGATGWAIRDPVTRVRLFADERTFDLQGAERIVVGTAPECSIILDEEQGVSRQHAAFERQGDDWTVSDLRSTNGIRQDGEDRKSFTLAPGMEVELGRAKLIAESQRSIELWSCSVGRSGGAPRS